jgi:hypothetical protein
VWMSTDRTRLYGHSNPVPEVVTDCDHLDIESSGVRIGFESRALFVSRHCLDRAVAPIYSYSESVGS